MRTKWVTLVIVTVVTSAHICGVCMCLYMHTCVYVCWSQRSTLGIFICHLLKLITLFSCCNAEERFTPVPSLTKNTKSISFILRIHFDRNSTEIVLDLTGCMVCDTDFPIVGSVGFYCLLKWSASSGALRALLICFCSVVFCPCSLSWLLAASELRPGWP